MALHCWSPYNLGTAHHYSSSSSTLGVDSVPEDPGVAPAMTDPSAALKLCVAENFSPPVPWSMLGLAFFKGLPTAASPGVSALSADVVVFILVDESSFLACGVEVKAALL